MRIKTGAIAYGGIMMALAVICIVLGGVLEMNTVFLLALSSFITGFVEKSFSVKTASIFIVGTTILGFLLAPQKLYAFTFCGFSIYILLEEYLEGRLKKAYGTMEESAFKKQKWLVWLQKGILYHVLLLIAVWVTNELFGLQTIFSQGLFRYVNGNPILLCGLVVLFMEAFWLIFDNAYYYVCRRYGERLCYHSEE